MRRAHAVRRRRRACSPRRRAPAPRRSSCSAVGSSGSPRCTATSTASTCALPGAGAAGRAGRGPGRRRRCLVAGFDLVADELELYDRIEGADLGDHRRGLPRRAELRGQGRRRGRRLAPRRGVPVVAVAGRGVRRRRRAHRGGVARRALRRGAGARDDTLGLHRRASCVRRASLDGARRRASGPVPSAPMVERHPQGGQRRLGRLRARRPCSSLLGVVAWVVRVIWPPLILAGAIVFLLNPVVTLLQAPAHPAGARHRVRPTSASSGSSSSLACSRRPLATDQYDELADEWPELRDDLEDAINDLAERSEEDDWPIQIPTYEEIEDQFSNGGNRPTRTSTPTTTASSPSDERRLRSARTASPSSSTPPASWAYGVPRRDHLRARRRSSPSTCWSTCPTRPACCDLSSRAGPRRCDGRGRRLNRDRRLLPGPAGRGAHRRHDGVDRHARSSTCRSG